MIVSKELVIEIGARFRIFPKNFGTFENFVERLLDFLEGKKGLGQEMLVVLQYKQQLA